ncbi:MAG: DUF5711 family protein [Acutalibacteraceae bacterium]
MDEKRRTPKRRGKQSYKKLNIKDKKQRTAKSAYSSGEVKTTVNQKINDFKASGLTLLKGKKSDNKFKLNFKFIISIVLALVIIIGVLVVVNSPTGIVEYIGSKISLMKSGESFPIEYDFSTGRNIYYSNGSLLVVTESDIKCYNKTGNLIYSRPHGFSDPVVKSSEIRTLVYGLNDSHYRIETPEEELVSKKTENNMPIISADIADCGTYVLATEANEDIALVTVYDKDNAEIYKYHSANNYVTNVTVSENGERIAVVSLTTKNAEFISKVTVFDINDTEPIFQKEFKDEVFYEIEYFDSKNICAITNKRYLNINTEVTNTLKYNPEFLNKFEISDDYIVLYNTADSNSLKGTVKVLSKDGTQKAKFAIEGNVSDISVTKGSIYILGEKVNEYDFEGKLVKSSEIKNGAVKLAAFSKGVAVLYSSGVDFIEEG